MKITFDEAKQIFKLDCGDFSYIMQILPGGILAHLYFGPALDEMDVSYLLVYKDRGFSGNPEAAAGNRGFSLDTIPQELGSFGVGDYRSAGLRIVLEDGSDGTDMRYCSHKIISGKPGIAGLPAHYAQSNQAVTLVVTLKDSTSGVSCDLFYSLIEGYSGLFRHLRVSNTASTPIQLKSAQSCSLDFFGSDFEWISLYGRWASERNRQRVPLHHGKQSIGSTRGASSHHYNPFVALVKAETTEFQGICYGFALVYSGNFQIEIEKTQTADTRILLGIHPENFSWGLAPGESFSTPEVVLVFSDQGLNRMSQTFHGLFRHHLCRGEYQYKDRPIVINNWEATYFDFDRSKLLALAEEAAPLGIELFVIDDGWFSKRSSDTSSLGDWDVNEEKLGGDIKSLTSEFARLGLATGLWFEPEMVSLDAELLRQNPDWCLQMPGRSCQLSRSQLVLDMSRQDIQDYLFDKMESLLADSGISYVKWDMNRHLSEVWSAKLKPEQQGECSHRHILGVYALLERLIQRFPEILFEGCSGGGGRFDPGMLYYFPQSWTSDNTDAIARLEIQAGTSLLYPLSAMAAHVSAVPNHQTGRVSPLSTRALVAMTGAFGYELDLTKLPEAEKAAIAEQISYYKTWRSMLAAGSYYRLQGKCHGEDSAWMVVAEDQKTALLYYVQVLAQANNYLRRVFPVGLRADYYYQEQTSQAVYLGSTLMRAGIPVPDMSGDAVAHHWTLIALP